MKIANLQLDSIETMSTKDALTFTSALLEKFSKDQHVFTGKWIQYDDKIALLNTVFELLVQTINDGNSRFFKARFMRATNWNCSNGIDFKEITVDEWREEVKIFNRINELF